MTTVYAALGVVALGAGAAGVSIGAWSTITGRRPGWLTTKTIRQGAERMWAGGIALAGLGLVVIGAVDLRMINVALKLAAFILIVCGVGLTVVATPRAPRPK